MNAYSSIKENISSTTTLFEGAVMVQAVAGNRTLGPGQQASTDARGNIAVQKAGDENHILAWIKEKFSFHDAAIEEIMKELSRHYEIKTIQYKGKIDARFNGSISKGLPLTEVLRIFSSTGYVHFDIENNNITVSP